MRGFFCLVRKNRFCFDDRGVACKCRGRGRDNLSVVGVLVRHPDASDDPTFDQATTSIQDQQAERRHGRTIADVITKGYEGGAVTDLRLVLGRGPGHGAQSGHRWSQSNRRRYNER